MNTVNVGSESEQHGIIEQRMGSMDIKLRKVVVVRLSGMLSPLGATRHQSTLLVGSKSAKTVALFPFVGDLGANVLTEPVI